MKIIISRKGLDSQYGGIPSPIIQTDQEKIFCPIPIPEAASDLRYDEVFLPNGKKVSGFLRDNPLKSMPSETCHLDPDLSRSSLEVRPEGWKKSFGQSHIAQDHLRLQNIGEDDVFLFFGWFKFAEYKNDKYQFIKSNDYPEGFHAIYGYLQVDKIYNLLEDKPVPDWLKEHPHMNYKSLACYKGKSNVIYTAKKYFKDKENQMKFSGSGLLRFHPGLILTKKGQSNRTHWELPPFFHPDTGVQLSYNTSTKWLKEGDMVELRSAKRGQEFVVKSDPDGRIKKWCMDIITNHTIFDYLNLYE